MALRFSVDEKHFKNDEITSKNNVFLLSEFSSNTNPKWRRSEDGKH